MCDNLKDIFPNNKWIKEGIMREITKQFDMDENENTTHQHLWMQQKAMLRGKFIARNFYIKKKKHLKSII